MKKDITQRIGQLTKKGTGIGTAFMHPKTNTPYILVAADHEDLETLLTLMCGVEESEYSREKFAAVKVTFD